VEFFLVADRGRLKVYLLDPFHSPNLRLVEEFAVEEARGRFADEFTDQAGAFPNGGSAGQGNSIAERQSLIAENEMRSFRSIARKIIDVLRSARPARWDFAAPSEINGAILDGLPEELRRSLRRNLRKDLVNAPPADVLAHFQAA
jgi:hypothetical protein